MPVVKLRVQDKSMGRYVENWDPSLTRVTVDSQTPEKFFNNWKSWFADNPYSDVGGVRGEFYEFDTDKRTLTLIHSETLLNLKIKPRVLNDDSRKTTQQEKTSSDMGTEVFSTHATNNAESIADNDF